MGRAARIAKAQHKGGKKRASSAKLSNKAQQRTPGAARKINAYARRRAEEEKNLVTDKARSTIARFSFDKLTQQVKSSTLMGSYKSPKKNMTSKKRSQFTRTNTKLLKKEKGKAGVEQSILKGKFNFADFRDQRAKEKYESSDDEADSKTEDLSSFLRNLSKRRREEAEEASRLLDYERRHTAQSYDTQKVNHH